MSELRRLDRPISLHQTVQESLRSYIFDNGLKPGAPLPPEGLLAQQLGIGRNSAREAIKALESIGVLETRRGIGVFVKEFSFQPLLDNLAYGLGDTLRDVEELLEIRRVLETGLIDRTVAEIGNDDLDGLRLLTAKMRARAERGESFPQEDRDFHQLLFRCQNNRMLSQLIDVFWQAFYKATGFASLDNADPMSTWRDHHEIVEAIASRDVDAARKRLVDHYAGISHVLQRNRGKS
jgi:DNA-binding FadR family transcriptional regulator